MATATLLCKQCNFENEPERVYCHNCGAKLDRALLPPEATKREDPQVLQDRVRSVVRPKGPGAGRFFRDLFASLAIAAALATLFLMSQPPRADLPSLSDDAVLNALPIADNLEELAQTPSPRRLMYTEPQVNAFLQYTLKSKEGGTVKFDRAFVQFQDGACRTTLQESIGGYPLYFSTTDSVEIRNGLVITHPVEGSIGRLRLSGKIMPYIEKAPIWGALDPYKKLVAKLGSVVFHKGSVVLADKAAATPL